MEAKRAPHHLRHDDVTLDLGMPRKSRPTQSAETGCTTSAYRSGGIAPSQGPRYGISSVIATHAPNSTAYLSAPGTQPRVPSSQSPSPALVPMISESRN